LKDSGGQTRRTKPNPADPKQKALGLSEKEPATKKTLQPSSSEAIRKKSVGAKSEKSVPSPKSERFGPKRTDPVGPKGPKGLKDLKDLKDQKALKGQKNQKNQKDQKGQKGVLSVDEILNFLDELYPEPRCGLDFADPFQLLTATILSAQCTDKRVNLVTPALFAAFPDPKALSEAKGEDIENLIKTCGLYKAKAANLAKTAKLLMERHDGRVPADLSALVSLPGVGRKTANVVLGDAFGIPGITVDTHLGRVSRRMGLTERTDPVGAEKDLMEIIPQESWTRFSHQMISHGRAICSARRPDCPGCGLEGCPGRERL
jgi:endonuclease-3